MKKKPHNWQLVEMYSGNFIFENSDKSYQVSVDRTEMFKPPYSIEFGSLCGEAIPLDKIYPSNACAEKEALQKAYEIMERINFQTMKFNSKEGESKERD